jgi:hypothetical protein
LENFIVVSGSFIDDESRVGRVVHLANYTISGAKRRDWR